MKCLISYFQRARQRQRTRKQLLELSDDGLKDIAVSRAESIKEGRKYFWQ